MAKLLLVEDDNNLREIYQARLQAEGYAIVSAQDGEEALVVAKAELPDLIISDVMMPKISGFEMLDILRNTDDLKHTKVIMLTALGQSDDQERADKLGADKYLVKSQVTLEDIVKTAHELLNDQSQESVESENLTPENVENKPAEESIVESEQVAQPQPEENTSQPKATPAEAPESEITPTSDANSTAENNPTDTQTAPPAESTPNEVEAPVTPIVDQTVAQPEPNPTENSTASQTPIPEPVSETSPEATAVTPESTTVAEPTQQAPPEEPTTPETVTQEPLATPPPEEPVSEPATDNPENAQDIVQPEVVTNDQEAIATDTAVNPAVTGPDAPETVQPVVTKPTSTEEPAAKEQPEQTTPEPLTVPPEEPANNEESESDSKPEAEAKTPEPTEPATEEPADTTKVDSVSNQDEVQATASTTAIEEAAMEAKIEDFVVGATSEPTKPSDIVSVPAARLASETENPTSSDAPTDKATSAPETPAIPDSNSQEETKADQDNNDKLTADAVDALVASTESPNETSIVATEKKTSLEPSANEITSTDIDAAVTPEDSNPPNTPKPIGSHNKIIQPIESEPKKDINELLAKEEAQQEAEAPVNVEPATPDAQITPQEPTTEEEPADPNKPNPADIAL